MGNTSSSVTSMLNTGSSTPGKSCAGSSSKKGKKGGVGASANAAAEIATERAKKVFGDVQESLKSGVKKLEEQDHPAAHLIDTVCGPYFDPAGRDHKNRKMRKHGSESFYSEDVDSDDDRTISEDEQTLDTDYNASTVNGSTVASSAAPIDSQSDYESEVGAGHRSSRRKKRDKRRAANNTQEDPSVQSEEEHTIDNSTLGGTNPAAAPPQLLSKPLASSFAKRCYFTKAGIGKTTQHYEGLTLTGNVVLMLAAAMKLKGCPTICDEDLRRVEQTYPNQFSRLPDELLLSSGWRRISKYCHFSNKPVPDGIPFFHSKQRLHPQGGYYFLLAAAVGMVRPIDVEPLTRDTLVLLETDYPTQCDAAPEILIQDPDEWTLVDKFCFFSGGPINTEEDVYYQADFDGNPIYMLAFLSPSLTPEELYKLEDQTEDEQGNPVPGLTSVAMVQEVESVYDLTERDFHDLKLYHLGPCRALPQYILQPQAWIKVLPPHFLEARHRAILRAQEYELANGGPVTPVQQAAENPMMEQGQPSQQLTVGATPVDPRFGEYPPHSNMMAHQQQSLPHHPHHPQGPMMGQQQPGQAENGYYMSPRQEDQQRQGFSSEYEQVGAHNTPGTLADPSMGAYHHHPTNPYPDHQQQHPQQHYHHPHDPQLQQQPLPLQHPFNHPHSHPSPRTLSSPHSVPSPSPLHHPPASPHMSPSPRTHPSSPFPAVTPTHPASYQQEDERSPHHSASFQREVEEEGAFLPDPHMAPLDEAIAARKANLPGTNIIQKHQGQHQGMDPPEELPPDPEAEESVAVSESLSPTPNNMSNASANYYSDQQENPLDDSQFSNELGSPGRGDAPSYGGGQEETPQYAYSMSPEKNHDEYYPEEQSRDDQYYDNPENLENQPGSQDHEFFNAPSGGADDEDDYAPSNASSFDPHSNFGRHPDDSNVEYYDDEDEADSRLELQESSSAEYFHSGHNASPSPIKVDHLRQLGRKQPPKSPGRVASAMASPTSQASSQNSVSEYSHSSAMRGAQELLKRNRQRRHEQARRRLGKAADPEVSVNDSMETDVSPVKSPTQYAFAPDQNYNGDVGTPQQRGGDDESASTWETNNSEALTSVISGSSVWTDNSSNPADRSSRRALILQMAKARMKSNKGDPAEKTIKEEKSGSVGDDTHEDYGDEDYGDDDHSNMQPQGITEVISGTTDLDFAADLD